MSGGRGEASPGWTGVEKARVVGSGSRARASVVEACREGGGEVRGGVSRRWVVGEGGVGYERGLVRDGWSVPGCDGRVMRWWRTVSARLGPGCRWDAGGLAVTAWTAWVVGQDGSGESSCG